MDVEDPFEAEIVDYSDMLHWELANTNPTRMNKAGISFALNSSQLEKGDKFKQLLLQDCRSLMP